MSVQIKPCGILGIQFDYRVAEKTAKITVEYHPEPKPADLLSLAHWLGGMTWISLSPEEALVLADSCEAGGYEEWASKLRNFVPIMEYYQGVIAKGGTM